MSFLNLCTFLSKCVKLFTKFLIFILGRGKHRYILFNVQSSETSCESSYSNNRHQITSMWTPEMTGKTDQAKNKDLAHFLKTQGRISERIMTL